MPAMIMGVAAGVVCYLACTTLKSSFNYDDSLDAFGVHGIGGTLGALLTGVFATRAIGSALDPATGAAVVDPIGTLEGGKLLVGQAAAVVASWVLAIVATFIILKVLDAVMGLRVTTQEEVQGLDLTQHGEEGYIFI
jgi:Amt family ammonium transporter